MIWTLRYNFDKILLDNIYDIEVMDRLLSNFLVEGYLNLEQIDRFNKLNNCNCEDIDNVFIGLGWQGNINSEY